MKVVVHDRTEALPARVRSYAERKLARLNRHFDRVLEAEVEFSHQRKRTNDSSTQVRIIVRMDGRKHPLAKAREVGPDAQSAIDLALDKVDRQVSRLKEKIKVERNRPAPEPRLGPSPRADGELERIRMKLTPETIEDARAALDNDGHVFRVYLDEDSGDVSVLFRRDDGSLAVIEPVT